MILDLPQIEDICRRKTRFGPNDKSYFNRNNVGKGGNAGYHYLVLRPQCERLVAQDCKNTAKGSSTERVKFSPKRNDRTKFLFLFILLLA